MPNLERLRRRLPLIVFLLLAIVLLMLVGLACACLTDDPMQAVDRALTFLTAPAAVAAAWTALFAALTSAFVVARAPSTRGRASPAQLQRFRF